MSPMMRRSRSVRVPSQAGKSRRKATCSGTSLTVLSVRASTSGFVLSVLKSGSLQMQ